MYNDNRKMKEDRRNGFNHAHCGRTQPITLGMWVGIRKKLRSLQYFRVECVVYTVNT